MNTNNRTSSLRRRNRSGAAILLLTASLSACLSRPPVLAPPFSGVQSVEGFGQANIEGAEATLKGRFSFRFSLPGFGRLDALDPLNRTAYFLVIREDEAFLVIPSKKVFAVEHPDSLMGRVLGFPVGPGEVIALLSDRWAELEKGLWPGAPESWTLETDGAGRVVRGRRDGLSFEILEFFKAAGVPKTLRFSDAPVTGMIKVISVRFNPADRPESFETPFIGVYARKSWVEIQEMLRDDD